MKKFRSALATLGVVALLSGAAVTLTAQSASAEAWGGGARASDPVRTGCVSGSYQVRSYQMVNTKHRQVQGRAALMYSPRCQTNWINIYTYTAGNRYGAQILDTYNRSEGVANLAGPGSEHTWQVSAPGNSCVHLTWWIDDKATSKREGQQWVTAC